MARIRYLPILLLAADIAATIATLTIAIVQNTPHARDVVAVLVAEFAVGGLLVAAQILVDRLRPAVVEQRVHVITKAPAVSLTRLAPSAVHVSAPELVS